ncbi:hypothetical protein B0T22DRAFT_173641 [Podospora appendiculata]|uniref:Uncharacterized protein n=1 Tax=Podospora appendiculata TaxID=314037 RepID=A0AAE0XBD9_9PEZI|nr:hypothetical protein B0T22DRAFT_173641 [Podospora appendiculata]
MQVLQVLLVLLPTYLTVVSHEPSAALDKTHTSIPRPIDEMRSRFTVHPNPRTLLACPCDSAPNLCHAQPFIISLDS